MSPIQVELRRIAALAAPVVATQLGSMLLLVVDNLMLGHFDYLALDASALGRVWAIGTLMLAQGVILGLDPIVSQAHGARDRRRLGAVLQRGLLLALLLSIPVGAAWLFTEPVLIAFGQDARLSADAQRYVLAQLPGLPAFLGFMALRGWLQGRGIVRPAMWVVLGANVFNALANWTLIFGRLGMPRLGVVGAGIATSISEVAMLAGLVVIVLGFRLQRGAWDGLLRGRAWWTGMSEIFRLGVPVGVQIGLEMWAFQIALLWAGRLGEIPLASHTIAINLASVAFMVPLGISIGASTRVGNLIGSGRLVDAQRAAWVALWMGGGVMAVSAVAFVVGREFLPTLYNGDPRVVAMCASVLPIAATFQLFDGVQVVGSGVLRGMGRTRPAAAFNLVAYYALGLPLAWWLAFERGRGLPGIWWGLCAGLAIVACAMTAWIARRGPARAAGIAPGRGIH